MIIFFLVNAFCGCIFPTFYDKIASNSYDAKGEER